MVDLSTKIGDIALSNPVLTASGTFGYGLEYSDFLDLGRLGGFVVKGTTLEGRQGNDYPRMAETPSGMLNAVGLQNKGVDHFIEHIYPRIRDCGSEVIVNVSGACIADYVACAGRIADRTELRVIELNISCPNVKQGGMAFGTTSEGASEVVSAVRKEWPGHLMVKLSPNVTSITDIAKAVEGAGADSVSLINTLLGMAIDVERRRPMLSTSPAVCQAPPSRPIAAAHGMAGSKGRRHPCSWPRRHPHRIRCTRVYHGRSFGDTGRHRQLHRPGGDDAHHRRS